MRSHRPLDSRAASRRIAFIGGLDRLHPEITALAAAAGVAVDFHKGDVSGRGRDRLDALVHRADDVVVFTGINSHAGVQLAKRFGARHGTPVHIVKQTGRTVARELIQTLLARGSAEHVA